MKVRIMWRDPDSDWPYFSIEEYRPNGWLLLRGEDFPDGSVKHQGDAFLAHRSEMESIEVME